MQLLRQNRILSSFAFAVASIALFGCNDSASLTGPKLVPIGKITGAWTGTYIGISPGCDSNAQLDWHQTDLRLDGTMIVPCLGGTFVVFGSFQGDTFTGTAMWGDPEFFPMKGTLSGSSLEITISNDSASGGTPIGQLHLHR